MFTPHQSSAALFVPPIRSRMVLSSAGAWEEIGQRWFPSFAGVVLFEASKQIFATQTVYATATRRRAYAPVASSYRPAAAFAGERAGASPVPPHQGAE